MSDFDRNYASLRGVGTDRAVAYDMGLRAHMIRVYNYMAGGVALTGLVAWFTYQASVVTNASGAIVSLTPFGQTLVREPAEMGADARPARPRVLHELPHRTTCRPRRRSCCSSSMPA